MKPLTILRIWNVRRFFAAESEAIHIDLLEHTPDVLTVMEAASVLRVGRTTMYRLIREHEIESVKIGRKILIPRKYLLSFIEKSSAI